MAKNSIRYSICKRCLDLIGALFLSVLLLPVCTLLILLCRGFRNPFVRRIRIGQGGRLFSEYNYEFGNGALSQASILLGCCRIPMLLNIIAGQASFVGPRMIGPDEFDATNPLAQRRLEVKPGLICYRWLRTRSNIDFESEWEADAEYVDKQGLATDIGILIRMIPALLYGKKPQEFKEQINILDIPIRNISMADALQKIEEQLENESTGQFCFVNADCLNIACKDEEYAAILKKMDMNLADGIGLKIAGKILNRQIRENVNGTDMFPHLCAMLERTGKSVFLLGAKPGVVDDLCVWIQEHYPKVNIAGSRHGYFTPEEEPAILETIRNSGADLVLVAFGVPRQEKWIDRNLAQTGAKAVIGVGGLFDFYSGRIARAPKWMREIGFEWLYRVWQEPGRMWKRYFIGNGVFLYRVYRERGRMQKEARKPDTLHEVER